jgi:hypothetical protein
MSTQDQARALMIRHHHLVKNREQCMLSRAAAEIGMPAETAIFWNHIQGKPHPTMSATYDRSGASFS